MTNPTTPPIGELPALDRLIVEHGMMIDAYPTRAKLEAFARAAIEADRAARHAAGVAANEWRDLLGGLVDVYFDGVESAPEHRCYVEGSLNQVMEQARAALADPAPSQAIPTGMWLAPMFMDVEMIRVAGETPGMKEIDSLSQTMQLRGYPANPKAFEGGAPLAQAYLAMRDSWLARHPAAPSLPVAGEQQPEAPIAQITMQEGQIVKAATYMPGLPDGVHELYVGPQPGEERIKTPQPRWYTGEQES